MTFRAIILMSVAALLAPFMCHAQADHRSPQVESLLAPLGAATNFSTAYVTPEKSSKDYKRMVDQLRAASPKTLRLLMEEVTNIGALQKGQIYITEGELADRAYRLGEAFKIAGTNAAPLFSDLRSEFLSGRSTWGAGCGLSFIGSEAWPVFLQGLTNSDRRVQVASMSCISLAPSADALPALPYLCGFATNYSESPGFRSFADRCLGASHIEPQVKVPALIKIGETETNWLNKMTIIYCVGEYGAGDKSAKEFLESMSKDKNRRVRAMSEKALRELEATR